MGNNNGTGALHGDLHLALHSLIQHLRGLLLPLQRQLHCTQQQHNHHTVLTRTNNASTAANDSNGDDDEDNDDGDDDASRLLERIELACEARGRTFRFRIPFCLQLLRVAGIRCFVLLQQLRQLARQFALSRR
eukprot:COSAG01_NODE_8954_length_2605_cov_1.425778_2_plen_133_part_00